MITYRVTFTPTAPYFFGSEKGFLFPGEEESGQSRSSYFARSKPLPSQTTILGALRYLLLPVKKPQFSYTPEEQSKNTAAVGGESFDISRTEAQDFGVIRRLSPVFLVSPAGRIHVPTPMDHRTEEPQYSPFSDYQTVHTPSGPRLYTRDYRAKLGLSNSFMDVETSCIAPFDSIFSVSVHTGINRTSTEKGLFKREYFMLGAGWSFGAYVTLSAAVQPPTSPSFVFLGQCKSTFLVDFLPEENTLATRIAPLLGRGLRITPARPVSVLYCLGDTLAEQSIYDSCLFIATTLRDHRTFRTDSGRLRRDDRLYRLLAAGSMFLTEHPESLLAALEHANCQQIGFNTIVRKDIICREEYE